MMVWQIVHALMAVLIALASSGCAHLSQTGDRAYCMTDYRAQQTYCIYDSYKACKADLRDGVMCHKR